MAIQKGCNIDAPHGRNRRILGAKPKVPPGPDGSFSLKRQKFYLKAFSLRTSYF